MPRLARRHRLLPAVAASVLTMGLVACTAPEPMPTPTPTPSPTLAPSGDGVLRIGTLLPTAGGRAGSGAAQLAGVRAAVREINRAGGVLGESVELVARDSGDAESIQAVFAELVAEGVDVVIGPASPALVERVLPDAVAAGVPIITAASTAPGPGADAGGFFARTIPAFAQQGVVLGAQLAADGADEVALAVVGGPLTGTIASPLAEALEEHGAELTTTVAVTTSWDVERAVDKLVAAAPDAVVLSAPDAGALTVAVLERLAAAGYAGDRLWITSPAAGDYSDALPEGALEGTRGLRVGIAPDDAFAALVRVEDPGLGSVRFAAEAYDATVIAALAAELAGDDGGRSLAPRIGAASRDGIPCTSYGACLDVLRTEPDIAYEGVVGPLRLDEAGEPTVARFALLGYTAENRPRAVGTIGG